METTDQALKFALLLSLLDHVRIHLQGIPMSLIDFVDWLEA